MDIDTTSVKRVVGLATGYNRLNDSERQFAGMILIAQAIEDHRMTMGRVADALDKLANNVGAIVHSVSDIRREIGKAVDIYKHSE